MMKKIFNRIKKMIKNMMMTTDERWLNESHNIYDAENRQRKLMYKDWTYPN